MCWEDRTHTQISSGGPDYLMSWQEYCNLASQYVSQGNYSEAERIIYQAFKEARQAKDLERICTALDSLGWLAFMQHKFADAEKIYQYVAKVKVQLYGADNVEIARTLKNLIAATYQTKQYERVVQYAKEAARIFASSLGVEHAECQAIAANLIELLKWLGRTAEAGEIYQYYINRQPPPVPVPQPAAVAAGQQSAYANQYAQTQAQLSQNQGAQYAEAQAQAAQLAAQIAAQQEAELKAKEAAAQQAAYQQQQQYAQQQHQQYGQQYGQSNAQYGQTGQQQAQYAQQGQQGYGQPQGYQQPADNQPPAQQAKDYSRYAKSICEVCQYEFEGPECLRCTSGKIGIFDPTSRLDW